MQLFPSDDTFALEHGAYGACGIPDGDTIIMTGGFGHNYVTRYDLICMIKKITQTFVFFLILEMDGSKKTSHTSCNWIEH